MIIDSQSVSGGELWWMAAVSRKPENSFWAHRFRVTRTWQRRGKILGTLPGSGWCVLIPELNISILLKVKPGVAKAQWAAWALRAGMNSRVSSLSSPHVSASILPRWVPSLWWVDHLQYWQLAVFREVSKSPVPLSPTSRHLSDLWFHSVPPLLVKQPDLLGFVVGLVFIVVVVVVLLLTILFSKLVLQNSRFWFTLSHSENWSHSVRLCPVSSYY